MKHKVYGITYAYIHGLTSDYERTSAGRIWKISFKYEEQQMPFNNPLQVPVYSSEVLARIKQAFRDNNIKDGDKVAIIYDVVNGNIIAIGKNRLDRWIKAISFNVVPFSCLGIKNCSLIPMFY